MLFCSLIDHCLVDKTMWMLSKAPYCPYKQSLIVKDKYNFKQMIFEYRTITLSLFLEFVSCLEVFPIEIYTCILVLYF